MTNYETLFQISNNWAPIVFAVLYFILFWGFIFMSIRTRTGVYDWLAFFALIRVAAFALRATLVMSTTARTMDGVGISYAVLYNVGFFALLLGVYNLIHDRERLARLHRFSRISHWFHRGRIMHILLFFAVAFGTAGYVIALLGVRVQLGVDFEHVMTYLFVAVAGVTFLLWIALAWLESRVRAGAIAPIGYPGHHLVLLAISLLLLVHAIFFTVTVHQVDQPTQNNETLWYPLAALPELLACILLLVPGLVIPRATFLRNRGAYSSGPGMAQNGTGYAAGPARV